MSKADYPYPEDEFDAVSPDAPTGVHRAPRSAWSKWWPFLVVLLVVPVLAYGVVEYLSRTDNLPDAGPTQGQEQPQEPQDPGVDEGTAPGDGTGDGTGEGEPGTEEPPVGEEPPVAPEPVLTTPVSVLNGARVSGLAGRVSEQLRGVGFTSVSADNANGPVPEVSTIYITTEDLRATAELVANTIGVPTIEVSPPDAGGGVTVVLVTDPAA